MKRIMRKALSVVLTLCMVVVLIPAVAVPVSAADYGCGDFIVTTDASTGFSFDDTSHVLTISGAGPYTIAMSPGATTSTTHRIEVTASASITLNGVNIVCTAADACAFKITSVAGAVTLTLADGTTNALKSGRYCAGLQKENSAKLTITGAAIGDGSLEATGGGDGYYGGAGIGGGSGGDGSNITISGGKVTATGGSGAAGIGGGRDGTGSAIVISGGEVTANGSASGWGAGIGGGHNGCGSDIEISGGKVTATGGGSAAGIGGGNGGYGSNIEISGGEVKATGDNSAAGIGGGNNGYGSDITISGGEVIATGKSGGAGIGGGNGGNGNDITISGGDVTATGGHGNGGAGIGGGNGGNGSDITISGGDVTTTGGGVFNSSGGGAGIGGGFAGTGSNINISGGDVTATGGYKGAGIGGGNNGTGSAISISGDVVEAIGGGYGAGIGGGYQRDGTGITIEGGDVTATGGVAYNESGAGIGGGSNGNGTTITIKNGNVTATGKYGASGIGGGMYGNGTGITIEDGDVTATGDRYGAGIGGGYEKTGSSITIKGGEVNATGGDSAAGIGGGYHGNGTDITISGGAVTAGGGESAAGIGGGGRATGSAITISGGTVSATSRKYGAGIGGGFNGNGIDITIGGGTVTAKGGLGGASYPIGGPGIGYGDSDVNTNPIGRNIVFNGGSIKAIKGDVRAKDIGGTPTNGTATSPALPVELYTLTVGDPAVTGAAVSALTTTPDLGYTYGMKDVKTDSDGKLYVYLPVTPATSAAAVKVGSSNYAGNSSGAAATLLLVPTSGGSSGAKTYKPDVSGTENGTVSVSPAKPAAGATVTVTVTPDEGYELDELVITDKDGNVVPTTDKGGGKYTFTQPVGPVTITTTFKPADEAAPGDSGDPGTDAPDFNDVSEADWFYEDVMAVCESGLMQGTGDGEFSPRLGASRAMIVTILWRLEGEPAAGADGSFDDVAAGQWYTDAVLWAAENGIVEGYGDGLFGTRDTISREQLAVIMYRYVQYKGGGFEGAWMFRLDFGDADQISYWAYEAMCWCAMNGIFEGIDGELKPGEPLTRAQLAAVLNRFINL